MCSVIIMLAIMSVSILKSTGHFEKNCLDKYGEFVEMFVSCNNIM